MTRLDYLRQDPEGYGQMAWQLGLAYWYFYENSGGKNAAARWFAQAVSVLEEENLQTDWAEDARIHAKISSYYETDKSADEEGERQQKEWDYWKDLKELWMLPAKERDSRIGRRIAEELLEQIILHAALLRDCGETREGFDEVLSGLRDALSEDLEDAAAQEVLEELRELCDEAEAAMRRTFGGES